MKRTVLILVLIVVATALFAGTLMEQSLKGYDPYLAEKDGFDSLYVNPAGIAGQTQAFSIAIEGGTWGKLENYELLRDNVDAMSSLAGGGDLTAAEAASLMTVMAPNLDQATLDAMMNGVEPPGTVTPENAENYDWSSLSPAELTSLTSNMSDPALQNQVMAQFDEVNYSIEAELRLGTLIKGFGFGLYGNTYMLYSLGAQGIEDMVFETGAIAGYGFDVKRFSFGFSGKFALLMADDPFYPFNTSDDVKSNQILYGYAWGLDAGVIWEPIDSLSFAVLFSDIIGSVTPTEDMASGTIDEFLSGDIDGPNGGYAWNFDVGAGLAWQPDWRGFRPRFSLDFYDLVAMTRSLSDDDYSGVEDFYQTDANIVLRHMRVGAGIRLLGFLDIASSYYMEYITLGLGVDIAFFEAFLEVKTLHDFSDVGANAMIKFKF